MSSGRKTAREPAATLVPNWGAHLRFLRRVSAWASKEIDARPKIGPRGVGGRAADTTGARTARPSARPSGQNGSDTAHPESPAVSPPEFDHSKGRKSKDVGGLDYS